MSFSALFFSCVCRRNKPITRSLCASRTPIFLVSRQCRQGVRCVHHSNVRSGTAAAHFLYHFRSSGAERMDLTLWLQVTVDTICGQMPRTNLKLSKSCFYHNKLDQFPSQPPANRLDTLLRRPAQPDGLLDVVFLHCIPVGHVFPGHVRLRVGYGGRFSAGSNSAG